MLKKVLKKWYYSPLAILALACFIYLLGLIYIQPMECRGEADSSNYDLDMGRFRVEFSNVDIRYGDSLLLLRAQNRLDEKWELFDDDARWDVGGKPCLVFCNLDFDLQKEIMVFGCHLQQSNIKELTTNADQYDDPDIGYTVGYYDLDNNYYHFKKLKDSPLYGLMYVKYYAPGFVKAFLAVSLACLSLVFYLINLIVKGGFAVSRKMFKGLSKK